MPLQGTYRDAGDVAVVDFSGKITLGEGSASVEIADKAADNGVRTRLDGYAVALGKSAWLMSLKCGCEASATLKADRAGAVLLQARSSPSSSRPQVGLP